MSALDLDRLEAVRAWAERRIEDDDRRRRLAPLEEALRASTEALRQEIVPETMVEPTIMVRRSVLNMERSQSEFPATLADRDAERSAQLGRLRARTAELRLWLEALA